MNKKEYEAHRRKIREEAEKLKPPTKQRLHVFKDKTDLEGRPHPLALFRPYLFVLANRYQLAEDYLGRMGIHMGKSVIFIDDEDRTSGRTGVVFHIKGGEMTQKEIRIRSFLNHYPDKFSVIEVQA